MNGARAIFTHNSVSPLIPPQLEGLGSAILPHACREMDGEIWQTALMAAQGVIECYHPCSSFKSACLEGSCKLGKTCSPPIWISWLKIEHLTCPNKVTWMSYSLSLRKAGFLGELQGKGRSLMFLTELERREWGKWVPCRLEVLSSSVWKLERAPTLIWDTFCMMTSLVLQI